MPFESDLKHTSFGSFKVFCDAVRQFLVQDKQYSSRLVLMEEKSICVLKLETITIQLTNHMVSVTVFFKLF